MDNIISIGSNQFLVEFTKLMRLWKKRGYEIEYDQMGDEIEVVTKNMLIARIPDISKMHPFQLKGAIRFVVNQYENKMSDWWWDK